MATGGGSAGGHGAAATGIALSWRSGEGTKISSQPDALVLFNPVYDNGPKGYGHIACSRGGGLSNAQHPQGAHDCISWHQDDLIPWPRRRPIAVKAVGSPSELRGAGLRTGFLTKAARAIIADTVAEMDAFW